MHAALTILGVVGLIAFAFGERTARYCVGAALIVGTLFFFYVSYRIATGSI